MTKRSGARSANEVGCMPRCSIGAEVEYLTKRVAPIEARSPLYDVEGDELFTITRFKERLEPSLDKVIWPPA